MPTSNDLHTTGSKKSVIEPPAPSSPAKRRVLLELFLCFLFSIFVVYVAVVCHSLNHGSMHKLDIHGFIAKFTQSSIEATETVVPVLKKAVKHKV